MLAAERRAALVAWARRRGALVVEDDYDAEFRYDREPVGALQGLAPACVVYAGSASKTLAPALRLGWLVLPERLAAPVAAARWRADRGSPALDELALADLIERGALDRHLRASRRRHRLRRDALVAALHRELPEARVEGVAAGLHAVVRLPEDVDEAQAVAAAARRGLAVEGLAAHALDRPTAGPALLVGYAGLPEAAMPRAVAELAAAVREAASVGPGRSPACAPTGL